MTYEEALSYIHKTSWLGSRPGLSRITELLGKLGDPQKELKCIHVAGTNGKGSFCAMLDSVLRKAGYKVGLFTSPYIEFFEERIVIDGRNIDKNELADLTETVSKAADTLEDPPTEFELITAIGFLAFRNHNLDYCIVECGMGGRLDSTNVIKSPVLSVITGIALDHTAFLGNTLEEIAGEKAGIIKPGCPVLLGCGCSEVKNTLFACAEKTGALTFETEKDAIRDLQYHHDGISFTYKGGMPMSLSLLGSYQPQNAANVLEAINILKNCGLSIPDKAVCDGLFSTKWKGRFERLCSSPDCYFDGGHNPDGVAAAVESVKKHFGDRKIVVITGVLADKDYRQISHLISGIAFSVKNVTPDNPRALSAEEYANCFLSENIPATVCSSYKEAVKLAFDEANEKDLPVLCMGSLYAYSDFKNAVSEAIGE